MSAEHPVYSIQRTYIIKPISNSEKRILTCDERIDIPTIEPLTSVIPVFYYGREPLTVIPCIELAGDFLSDFNMTFETNDGVTVQPIKIHPGQRNPLENPYNHYRYVLVLPRGTTGVKSCKLIYKATGKEVQHNLTFGIMSPPYNYDNMLFGHTLNALYENIRLVLEDISKLAVSSRSKAFTVAQIPKAKGEKGIDTDIDMLYFTTVFSYPSSSEATVHHPVITLYDGSLKYSYTLALNEVSQTVSIDLLMSMITVYNSNTGEVMQQFKLPFKSNGFDRLSFANFDDITDSTLNVEIFGRRVE